MLAAGVVAAAFGVGFIVGDRGSGEFPHQGSPIAMHAPGPGSTANASILIGDRDEVGNWPLLVHVSGLKPLPKGEWYELYLTRKGKPAAYCGSFAVNEDRPDDRALQRPVQAQGLRRLDRHRQREPAGREVLLTT